MSVYKEIAKVGTIYRGGTKIGKVYKGSTLVYSGERNEDISCRKINNTDVVLVTNQPITTPNISCPSAYMIYDTYVKCQLKAVNGTIGTTGSTVTAPSILGEVVYNYFQPLTLEGRLYYIYQNYSNRRYFNVLVSPKQKINDVIVTLPYYVVSSNGSSVTQYDYSTILYKGNTYNYSAVGTSTTVVDTYTYRA